MPRVDDPFGEAHGELAAHLGVLHLRVAGKKVWGRRYPFHEAAFLGGPDTVRGLHRERYAGDAAVFGNAELRLPLFEFTALLPVRFGVLGLADAGRVYLHGESSKKWHMTDARSAARRIPELRRYSSVRRAKRSVSPAAARRVHPATRR